MVTPTIPEEFLLPLIFIALAVVYFIYRIYSRTASLKAIEKLLKDYYNEQGIQVISISSLKTADKLKYGVPMNPYISFYYSTFSFLQAGNEKFYRLVETKDKSGKEHLRYVEVSFSGNTNMKVNEFESFEF